MISIYPASIAINTEAIALLFIAVTSLLIYRNNSTKTDPLPKDKPPSDQPNNPPQSPPLRGEKENPTLEREKRVKQLLAEGNEFLLKTNPKLVPIPDDFIGELLEKGYNLAGDIRKLFD